MKRVSVVIPLFNEEGLVEELIRRLQEATQNLNYSFEFLMVDDGSRDETLARLLEGQKKESRIKVIQLSRNWGHQNAYNAGIDHASGDAVILMDGDLEDPPEEFASFLEKWEEGYEVVYAVKRSRRRNLAERFMFGLFYKVLRFFSDVEMEEQAGMFSLLDKRAAEHLKLLKEKNKYYAGLRSFIGFRQIGVPYRRQKRYAGSPKQDFRRLFNYAMNAYFSFSFLPIRMMTYFGIFVLMVIVVFGFLLLIGRMFDIPFWYFQELKALPGWTTIVLLILFLMAIQIVFLGIQGEYIARILDEVRPRPYYIVERVYENDT